jgi:hypothetical protein
MIPSRERHDAEREARFPNIRRIFLLRTLRAPLSQWAIDEPKIGRKPFRAVPRNATGFRRSPEKVPS